MVTRGALIDDIFIREGDRYAVVDQPTGRGGITLPVLVDFYKDMVPSQVPDLSTLQNLTHQDARGIVDWKLTQLEKSMGLVAVRFEPLRLHLLDFAYNSGQSRALRWLQRSLRVPRTGVMDGLTVSKLAASDQWLIHHVLLFARLQMIDAATDAGGSVDKKYEEGLENRTLSFSLLDIP